MLEMLKKVVVKANGNNITTFPFASTLITVASISPNNNHQLFKQKHLPHLELAFC